MRPCQTSGDPSSGISGTKRIDEDSCFGLIDEDCWSGLSLLWDKTLKYLGLASLLQMARQRQVLKCIGAAAQTTISNTVFQATHHLDHTKQHWTRGSRRLISIKHTTIKTSIRLMNKPGQVSPASSERSVRRCMRRKAHKALKSLLWENLCQAFSQRIDH